MKRKLVLFLLLLSSVLSFSQSRGTRIGWVQDASTHEPLIGAAILIKGSTQGTTTDFDGIFHIEAQVGDTLAISYVGYRSQLIRLSSAQSMADTLYIYMQADNEVLDEVAVVARRRTDTDMALLTATRKALTVQEGISSQQIGRTQDKDAAEVIRRVPGISLIDDKFVMVRGLSQRYNQVWLNGAAVPSSEADSRAFSFDLIPSSQMDNMVIVKSPAPEYPADFSGGMVLITTKDVPDYSSWSVQIGGAINDQTHFHPFMASMRSGAYTEGVIGRELIGIEDIPQSVSLIGNGFNNDWRIRSFKPVSDLSLAANGSIKLPLPQSTDATGVRGIPIIVSDN